MCPRACLRQFQDELFFENFKAARDEEERAAKEAAEAARRVRVLGFLFNLRLQRATKLLWRR